MILTRIDGTVILNLKTAGSASEVVREALRRKLDLTDASFYGDLTGLDFTGATCYNAEFHKVTLDLCNFTATNLRRVMFYECSAELAVFHGADMDNVNMQDCRFTSCDLAGAQLSDATLHRGYYTECSFYRARAQNIAVSGIRFTACDMRYMIFKSTVAKACRFTGCDFSESEFGRAVSRMNKMMECICPLTGKNLDHSKRQYVKRSASSWVAFFKELRLKHGYSQEFVARAVGTMTSTIKRMESGGIAGNIILLIGLMRLYNLSLADVYYGAGNTNTVAEETSELRDGAAAV